MKATGLSLAGLIHKGFTLRNFPLHLTMSGKVDDIWSPRLTRVGLTTHSNNISHKWWHFLSSATQKDKAHHRQAKQLRLLPSVQRAPPTCQNERQVIWYYLFVLCCPDFCRPPVTLQYSWFPDTRSWESKRCLSPLKELPQCDRLPTTEPSVRKCLSLVNQLVGPLNHCFSLDPCFPFRTPLWKQKGLLI